MADIFVSYASRDQGWAFWIGQELEKLGHVPRIHEWEISAGGDIAKWMDERLQNAAMTRDGRQRASLASLAIAAQRGRERISL
jgi:hypothetical protein